MQTRGIALHIYGTPLHIDKTTVQTRETGGLVYKPCMQTFVNPMPDFETGRVDVLPDNQHVKWADHTMASTFTALLIRQKRLWL